MRVKMCPRAQILTRPFLNSYFFCSSWYTVCWYQSFIIFDDPNVAMLFVLAVSIDVSLSNIALMLM